MNHSLQTLQERRWLPVKMIFFGIFVGIVAAFVTVLYRFMLQFAEAILFRMIEFTDGHPFYMAIWLLCLMLLAFLVAKITAWESMCSGSGIPQVQGEIKGFFDVNWRKLLISKMIGGTFCIIGGTVAWPGRAVGTAWSNGRQRTCKTYKTEQDKRTLYDHVRCRRGSGSRI